MSLFELQKNRAFSIALLLLFVAPLFPHDHDHDHEHQEPSSEQQQECPLCIFLHEYASTPCKDFSLHTYSEFLREFIFISIEAIPNTTRYASASPRAPPFYS